jgi:hypothetical protein
MDSNKFFKQLRQIIREEVEMAVHKEMNILYESLDKVSKKSSNNQRIVTEAPQTTKPVFKKAATKKSAVTFSNNPLLNDILSETAANGFSSKDFHGILEEDYNPAQLGHNDYDEWPTMKNMSSMGMSSAPSAAVVAPRTDIDGRPVTELAPEVEQALTRDYSALMKAINKKKGS